MKPDDRVIYLRNFPVDLNNDLGTIKSFADDGDPVVAFDDGFTGPVNREDISLVVEIGSTPVQEALPQTLAEIYGCSETPCPWHHS